MLDLRLMFFALVIDVLSFFLQYKMYLFNNQFFSFIYI